MDLSPEPLVILRNDGAANFTDISDSAVGGFTGWLREIALADVDADGDLDVGAPGAWNGPAVLFMNDGSATATQRRLQRRR